MPTTGKGGSIAFGTSNISASWTRISQWEKTLGKLESSHLGTTGEKTFLPDDLEDAGEMEVDLWFEATAALPSMGVSETITVTFPKENTSHNTAATLAGTGFISGVGTPEMVLGTLKKQNIKFVWTGVTGPTFTVES